MANKNGNLFAMGGDSKKAYKSRRTGTKGYYKLGFVESYSDVTENDVSIRNKYAADAIARYLKTPHDLISFRKKSTKQTLISLDEVFYVKAGDFTVGKVSIRVQRMFSKINLDIIYQDKHLTDPDKKTSNRGTLAYNKNNRAKSTEKKRRDRNAGNNSKYKR